MYFFYICRLFLNHLFDRTNRWLFWYSWHFKFDLIQFYGITKPDILYLFLTVFVFVCNYLKLFFLSKYHSVDAYIQFSFSCVFTLSISAFKQETMRTLLDPKSRPKWCQIQSKSGEQTYGESHEKLYVLWMLFLTFFYLYYSFLFYVSSNHIYRQILSIYQLIHLDYN